MNYFAKFKNNVFFGYITTEAIEQELNEQSSEWSYTAITQEQFNNKHKPSPPQRTKELINSIKFKEKTIKLSKQKENIKEQIFQLQTKINTFENLGIENSAEKKNLKILRNDLEVLNAGIK